MEGTWRYAVLLLGVICAIQAVPVTKSEIEDPVQQLEQLKIKIAFLEKTLKDLDQNIDTYVAAEKKTQAVVAKPRYVAPEPSKRHHMTLRAQTDTQSAQDDAALQQYVQSLSPEDQQMLSHMKSKVKFLQSVLSEQEQGPNPGEPEEVVFDVKRSESPPAVNAELQQFESELSPEDLQMLHKLKSKAQYLQAVLEEGPQPANQGETQELDKRSELPSEADDAKLQEFESQLSPDELKMLMRMKSKVKFLQGALNEAETGPNPNEKREVVFDAKRSQASLAEEDPQLQEFENQLSEDDKVLLKKFGSRVKFLQGALHEGPQAANPGETAAQEKRSEIAQAELDPQLQEFVSGLSQEDQALLKKLSAKLPLLQEAVHEGPQAGNPGEEGTTGYKKRQTEDSAQALQDFMANLTPEDLTLIKHHKEKMNLLQGALGEPQGQANPGEELTQEKRGNPEAVKPKPPTIAKLANPATVKKDNDNQHPPATAKAANQKAPKPAGDDEVVFTAADRVLLKTVAGKLEELRKTLEAFKQAQNTVPKPALAPVQQPQQYLQQAPANAMYQPIQAAQVPAAYQQIAQIPIGAQIPQQVPQQVQAQAQVPAVAPAPLRDILENLPQIQPKQSVIEKRYAAPVTNGRFGSFVRNRMQRAYDEGWHEAPLGENSLGKDKRCSECDCGLADEDCDCVKCPKVDGDCNGEDCVESAKRTVQDNLNIKQLLRALSKAKTISRKRRLAENQEKEANIR